MEKEVSVAFLVSFLFLFFSCLAKNAAESAVDVGVILDSTSVPGKWAWETISMAADEFCAVHENVTTRVVLHLRDPQRDVAGAASAALDLVNNVKAKAIITGATTPSQTELVAGVGSKAHIPVISFSVTSPFLCSVGAPYFICASPDGSAQQVGAIAAIVKLYGWREVVLVYEDNDYGSAVIPFLSDVFNSVDIHVPYRSAIPSNASDDWFGEELNKLMTMHTRVFVAHMMPDLGFRFFQQARAVGLMSQGCVWIATDSLTNSLETLDRTVLDSMEGMIGVRSYVPKSDALARFSQQWRGRFSRDNPPAPPPTPYQLWAYDAAWAIALSADSVPRGPGPELLEAILGTQFRGLSGEFRLVQGQLQSSAFEILNVIDNRKGWKRVGFWSPVAGITKNLKNSSLAKAGLKKVTWPENSANVPKGCALSTRLKIGVRVKNGFDKFVNVKMDQATGSVAVTGYCIDVFEAVMKRLPYPVPYEYVPIDGGASYDDLVSQVYFKRLDAVVGDTTITANRSLYVDFTLPYTESRVAMIIRVKEEKGKSMWIFLKPFAPGLWFASLSFFCFTGFVVWLLEHRINAGFRGPPLVQLGTVFYFILSTIVFAQQETLCSRQSRIVIVTWMAVVLILTSSYTASLTTMLNSQQQQLPVVDVSELIKNGDHVGYQNGSFVAGLLKEQLKFDVSKLKNYSTPAQYAEALSLGSKNGGVTAIFDETPYLNLFLSEQHCTKYAMVGDTCETSGFGFVFPRGSPLVSDVSRAILRVTEGDTLAAIEKRWLFGDQTTCASEDTNSLGGSSSLNVYSFGGLFLVSGSITLLALLAFMFSFVYKEWDELKKVASPSLWKTMVAWARHYDRHSNYNFRVCPSNYDGSSVIVDPLRHSAPAANNSTVVPPQSPISIISDLSLDMNIESPDEGRSSTEPGEGRSSIEPGEETVIGEAAGTSIEMAEIRS